MATDITPADTTRSDHAAATHHQPASPPGMSTQAVHAGELRQKAEGAISTPMYCTSTFTFESTDDEPMLGLVAGTP
ncbi:MAG: hypothetical protein ACO1RT_18765, partial [Planctomycetaceae bacterium]